MSVEPKHKWTVEEYLAFERESDERHEFINGEVYAMVGASEAHILILTNIVMALGPQMVQRGCLLYTNDLRIHIRGSKEYYYPDLVGICGEREFEDQKPATLLNPQLIIEILSPSTEQFDRGKKFLKYQAVKSLQTYVLVSQDEAVIEMFVRDQNGWHYSKAESVDGVIELASVGCTLPLAAVYQGIDFDEEQE